jgi:hypothetical protein
MTVRLAIGIVVFLAGAALWFFSRQRAAAVADRRAPLASLPRLGLAMGALGLSVLASTQPGLGWSVSSICYSLFAILLLVRVVRDSLRR